MCLDRLLSPTFRSRFFGVATAEAWHSVLGLADEVHTLSSAVRDGAVTEDQLRRWVESLLAEFRRGERFVHEAALAAIAVCMEDRQTAFADEYLRSLSELQLQEIPIAPRVARLSLKRHQLHRLEPYNSGYD